MRRINFARCWLYEILSGNPPIDAPYWDHTIPAFRFQQYYDNFFPTLTEELTTQLHDIAHRYLQRCRIAEPLSWQPSPGLLDDLTLPGPEPNTVDPALIQIITEELPSLSTVAARLHTTTEIARYHLEAAPPARVGSSPNRYRAQIAKDDLLRLRAQGFSAQRIATVLGVSKPTIYAAARRHNVDISLRPYRITIDKDWLRTQIIDKHRSFAEIADELGVSESAVSRKAAKYGLPKPSEATRGCGTQRRNLATVRSLVRHLPDGTSPEDWITHALTKEKLSYAEAAARLGVQPQMIRRLARELGLPPAVRHSPGQSGRGRAARYSTQFRDKALAELDHLLHSEAALDKTRAVQKVADHLGIAECTLWKWSRQRDTSAAQSSANPVSQGTPKILAPAFRRRGANRRLTTLTRVAYYDTVAQCAQDLEISPSALNTQLRTLEDDFGQQLLESAQRNKPLQLTPLGKQVVNAARQYLIVD